MSSREFSTSGTIANPCSSTCCVNATRSPDLSCPQLLEEPDDRLDPTIKIWYMELLVGSVQVVIGQAEAHHHARELEHVLEIGHDGNGAAGADEDGVFLEDLMHGFGSGLDEAVVGADHAGRALAEDFDLGLNALGRQFLHVVGVLLEYVVGVLIGHHAHGDLGVGEGRDHRLGDPSDESSGHAMHFQGGTLPCARHHPVNTVCGTDFRSHYSLSSFYTHNTLSP